MADRIIALTPQGDVLTLLSDGNEVAALSMDQHFRRGTLTGELMMGAVGKIAPGFASIAFGGPDLKTVYVGSSMGTTIPYFSSPVAGLRSEEHTSELQSLMRISYAVFCLKKKHQHI